MATPASPQGNSSSSSTAASANTSGPGAEVAPDRLNAAQEPPKQQRVEAPALNVDSAAPAGPDATATEAKKGRRSASAPPPKEAERSDQNTIERPGPGEAAKAEPLGLDARVAADIARLAAIRARDRAEAERVLNDTRTKQAEPLARGDKPRRKTKAADAPAPTVPAADEERERDPLRIPREIANDFVRIGQKYFHRDNPERVAWVDAGTTLKTPSSSPELARTLVVVAEARGWDGLKVRGSAEFKREVFIEASARGLRVTGYGRASDADLAEVEARVARYSERNAIEQTSARARDFREQPAEAALRRPDLASAVVAAEAVARLGDAVRDPKLRERLQGGFREQLAEGIARGDVPRSLDDPQVRARIRVPEGVYLEAGRAPYKHDRDEKENFYVRYRRADGSIGEEWGKRLEEALKEAKAAPGDTIRLEREGAKPVRVVGNVRDAENRVVGKQEIESRLNEWKVEVVAKGPQERQVPPPERSRGGR